MEGIQVSIDKIDLSPDTFLIKVGGYVDTTTSQELDRTIEELLKNDVIRLIVDLEDVDYISSAGWGIFISEIKSIRRKGGDIKLIKMAPDVFEVFELLEFHHILKAYESMDDALSDFEEDTVADVNQVLDIEETDEILVEESTDTAGIRPSDDIKTLSLEDRIKMIVRRNPEYNVKEIRKELMTKKYGGINVGMLQTYLTLRRLELQTIKKRIIFSRS
jgi:anti-sigma B factor antagonist